MIQRNHATCIGEIFNDRERQEGTHATGPVESGRGREYTRNRPLRKTAVCSPAWRFMVQRRYCMLHKDTMAASIAGRVPGTF